MKKFSNKILIIVLVLLVGIFVLSRVFRSPGLESNLKKELVKIDTTKVTEVRIQTPQGDGQEIRLVKGGKKWRVSLGDKQSEAGAGVVESMLGVLKDLQSQRMVTRKKERWDDYVVGEGGTRVSVYNGSDKLADLKIGKAGFKQAPQQGMGGGNGSAFTYVRLTDENEVYASDGFISTHFNRSFNDWRNQLFLKVNRTEVTKLEFNYPDSSFVLEKKDSLWYAGGTQAVETKVNQYFSRIRLRNISEFEDQFIAPGAAPIRLQISGVAGPIITAQAWTKGDGEFVLTSTLQEGVYFRDKQSGVIKDVFVGQSWFTNP